MKKSPLISVIIPTYKRPQECLRAVRSVLAQTYQNFEVIVGDDFGKDRTLGLLAALGDRRVFYFDNEGRGGSPSSNRNLCIERSSGDYLTFLDSDDFMLSQRLELQLQAIQVAGNGVEFAVAGTRVIKVERGKYYHHRDLIPSASGDCREAFFGRRFSCYNTSLMITRKALDEVGGWDPKMEGMDDPEFLMRFLLKYDGARVCELCTVWFDHLGDSHSSVASHRSNGIMHYLKKYPELCESYPVWYQSRIIELLKALYRLGEIQHYQNWMTRLTKAPLRIRLYYYLIRFPTLRRIINELVSRFRAVSEYSSSRKGEKQLFKLLPLKHLEFVKEISR